MDFNLNNGKKTKIMGGEVRNRIGNFLDKL